GIETRQFDKRELWKRLAALQKQRTEAGLSQSEKEELGKLRKRGESMAKQKQNVTKSLADALQKSDLAKAQEALRELSRRLRDKSLSKRRRTESGRQLRGATERMSAELNS